MSCQSRLVTNRVKDLFKQGKPTLGTWLSLPTCLSAEAMGYVGFDWFVIDTEHGAHNIETVENLVRTVELSGAVPMARIGWNDLVYAKWMLDRGVMGLVIPLVNTKEEAEKAVRACKYPPEGLRGVAGGRITKFGHDGGQYMKTANDNTLVVVQIETAEAVKNVDEIFSVEGVDAGFVGPADLSISMGIFGQLDHPRFKEAIEKVLAAGKKHGVAVGMHTQTPQDAAMRIGQGMQFVALSSELGHAIAGAKKAFGEVYEATGKAVGLKREA